MGHMNQFERKQWDVVIYGSGLRAASAAMTLTEGGKSVLLVLPGGFAGSEITSSLHGGLVAGISRNADLLRSELQDAGAAEKNRGGMLCDSAAALVRILKRLERADLLFYVRPAGIIREGKQIKGVIFASKSGIFAPEAKVFIDASDSLALFRHTDTELRLDPTPDAERVFSFRLESEPAIRFGSLEEKDLKLGQTFWEGEFQADIRNGTRLDLPGVLSRIQEEHPEFRGAMVSNTAYTPLFLSCTSLKGPSTAGNLLAEGNPKSFVFEDYSTLSAERMREGELLARDAERILPGIRLLGIRPEEVCVSSEAGEEEKCDVLICGGGTAGAVAAIAAGRMKVSVSLWEAMDYLGGTGTGGMIPCYYYGTPGGLQDELDEKTKILTERLCGKHSTHGFHPVAKMIVLEEEACRAGVRISFGQTVCGVETSPEGNPALPAIPGNEGFRNLDSVSACSESGIRRGVAETFIDSTGDADVAVAAGAGYTVGRHYDGLQHIYSLPAIYLDRQKEVGPDGKETGSFHYVFRPYNIDAGYCDATDPWDLSRARRTGILEFDRQPFYNGPGRVRLFSALVGARASRQIQGDFRMTLSDQIRGAEFPDVIGYASAHYDNHAQDYENESPGAMLWSWALDSYNEFIGCEIPYRILLPAGIGKLLVACRSLSLEYDAHLQFRMQRDMQRIGEAAGIASALAVKSHTDPRHIDISALQKELSKTRALLGSEKSGYHSDGWKPENFYPEHRLFELGENGFSLSGRLLPAAEEGVHEVERLKSALDSPDPELRYEAALKLATAGGNPRALSLLPDCIRERCAAYPKKSWKFRSAPYWKIAIGVCGAMGYKEAASAVEEVLSDPGLQDQQAMILAVRALGRIGGESSVKVLEELLKRPDLPSKQEFPHWYADKSFFEDSLWKLELAVYETLHALGKKEDSLLEKHLADPRAYVRKAAELVRQRTED